MGNRRANIPVGDKVEKIDQLVDCNPQQQHNTPRFPKRSLKPGVRPILFFGSDFVETGCVMARKRAPHLELKSLLANVSRSAKSSLQFRETQAVFSQGDPADAVFYIETGKVKLAVRSKQNKEAIIAIMEPGSFFGEECMVAGQTGRLATATCIEYSNIMRIKKGTLARLLHDARFSERFTAHLLSRNLRIQEDLVDQLFNSSEKRLARLLLLLSHFGKEGRPEPVLPRVSQETLAAMVGTTRSRVSFFLNKFRKLGFVDYNGGLLVHSSLLNVVLHD